RAATSTGSPASTMSTKRTPLTTRPASTSRQGMMRRARATRGRPSVAAAELVRELLGLGEIQGAFVDGAAGDGALDALVRHLAQGADVIEVAQPPGGDDGHGDLLAQLHGGLDVHARQGAVPADVGKDDAGDAVVLEA